MQLPGNKRANRACNTKTANLKSETLSAINQRYLPDYVLDQCRINRGAFIRKNEWTVAVESDTETKSRKQKSQNPECVPDTRDGSSQNHHSDASQSVHWGLKQVITHPVKIRSIHRTFSWFWNLTCQSMNCLTLLRVSSCKWKFESNYVYFWIRSVPGLSIPTIMACLPNWASRLFSY